MSFVFFKQSLSFIINISSDFSQWSELCRMFRDLIWYHLLLSVFPAAGLQPSQGVHRRPGSAQVHVWGFLEDGLGAEHWNHCYDHKPGGERKSGFIFHQLNMKVSAFLLMFPLIRVPLSLSLSLHRGSATSTGRRRTASSTGTWWWRWRAPRCTPATPWGASTSGTLKLKR